MPAPSIKTELVASQEGFVKPGRVLDRPLVAAREGPGVDEVREAVALREASRAIPPAAKPIGAAARQKTGGGEHHAGPDQGVEIEYLKIKLGKA